MTSETEHCKCVFFTFPQNNSPLSCGKSSMDYTVIKNKPFLNNHNNIPASIDWDVKQNSDFSNTDQDSQAYLVMQTGSGGPRSKANTLRSNSLSTEHLHKQDSPADTISPSHVDSFKPCFNSHCLCPASVVQRSYHFVSPHCQQCSKPVIYPSQRLHPSPRRIKGGKNVEPCSLCSFNRSPGPYTINSKSNNVSIEIGNSNIVSTKLNITDRKDKPDITNIEKQLRYNADFDNMSYELSEDLQAKEIEFMERCYGGRMRAQRAARIIQSNYRDYRLRAEYARLRLEKCYNRSSEHHTLPHTISKLELESHKNFETPNSQKNSFTSVEPNSVSAGSLEDIVLEQAYVDWTSKAASNEVESHLLSIDVDSNVQTQSKTYDLTRNSQSNIGPSVPIAAINSPSSKDMRTDNNILSRNNNAKYMAISRTDSGHVCSVRLTATSQVPSLSGIYHGASPPVNPLIPQESQLRIISPTSQACKHPTFTVTCTCGRLSCSNRNNFCRRASSEGVEKSSTYSQFKSDLSTREHDSIAYQISNQVPRVSNYPSNLPTTQAILCPHCNGEASTTKTGDKNPITTTINLTGLHTVPISTMCSLNGYSLISVPTSQSCKSPAAGNTLTCAPFTRALIQAPGSVLNTVPVMLSNHRSDIFQPSKIIPIQQQHQQYPLRASCRGQCAHPLPTSYRVHMHRTHLQNSHRLPSQINQHGFVTQLAHGCSCVARHPSSQDKRRKRAYRVGLNLFNKSPVKGIDFLIKYGFLDKAPELIARFLLNRKGLSRVSIGDYLGNTKNELAKATMRQFMRELDFRDQEVDESLRLLLCCFRTPGESQKIVHLLTEFQTAYVEQNSARVKAQFRSIDSVMILAYAIVMLHTDMYSPNVRPQLKMTREEFVRNLRGIDSGEDLDRNLLLAIFDRIQSREMSVLPDHTDQVRKIQQHLTGPMKPLNLCVPQRRLVCYCRLYEVPDKNKRERSGAHQREVFLFNDLLLITKAVQKKRRDSSIAYQVRMSIHLLGIKLCPFETIHHPNGLELLIPISSANLSDNHKENTTTTITTTVNNTNINSTILSDSKFRVVTTLNTKTLSDRSRFMEDLQECILEVTEMDRLRIEEEMSKQKLPSKHNSDYVKHKSDCTTTITNNNNNNLCKLNESIKSSPDNPILNTTTSNNNNNNNSCKNKLLDSNKSTFSVKNYLQTSTLDSTNDSADLQETQRLSGDSGLLIDLDSAASSINTTPTMRTNQISDTTTNDNNTNNYCH